MLFLSCDVTSKLTRAGWEKWGIFSAKLPTLAKLTMVHAAIFNVNLLYMRLTGLSFAKKLIVAVVLHFETKLQDLFNPTVEEEVCSL